jgi:glutamyl-tRNA reductase
MSTSVPAHIVGVSHHTASLAVREQLALTPAQIGAWLERERRAERSLMVLSTCNRFELYWWGDEDQEASLRDLARVQGSSLDARAIYRRDGVPALRHLFLVAAGLDSQVLGEYEILGQVRRAHEQARAAGTTTWQLDAAVAAALTAGRQIRLETGLGKHPGSVGSAALAQAARCWGGSLESRRILLLGAGEVAEGVIDALGTRAYGSLVVLNRTAAHAEALVTNRTAETASWDALPTELDQADVVIAATAAPQPVLDAPTLAEVMRYRGGRPAVVLDLAIPRNVDPAARDLPGIRLFDLDDLRLEHCPAVSGTAPALDEAEVLIRDAISRFGRRLRIRAAAPHLAELHQIGERLAEEEAQRALAELEPLSEAEREVVRRMAGRLVRRLLYPASQKMREAL